MDADVWAKAKADETLLEADPSVPYTVDQATPPADEPDKQSSEASR
jgi:hypothetical protein